MIGVIGSADSVRRTLLVAGDIGLLDQVIGRSYRSLDQVPAIAEDLDGVCQALLFTGRVPFARAVRDARVVNATVDYVPHSAIDLYRTLAMVLLERNGLMPDVSIDTIDEEVVQEVFHDLHLPARFHVLSLDADGGALRSSTDVANFHLRALQAEGVQLGLTCLGAVNEALTAAGAPVTRIEHTRSTLRMALTAAASSVRMAKIKGSQAAIAILQPLDGQPRGATPPHVGSYAQRLGGVVRQSSETAWTVHTTYGAVELMLMAGPGQVPLGWTVGFGVGTDVMHAEANAQRALALGNGTAAPFTVLADGSVLGSETRGVAGYRLRETDEQLLAHARGVGLRSLTLARLAAALRTLDPSSITARELAGAYGIQVRSARRMLASLEHAGLASVSGIEGPPRAGRPQTVYCINVDRLVPRR